MGNPIVNFIKGIFIGMGAVLPGLSGGALAAIFGVYEPLINFASNVRKNFLKNLKFFIPIALGGVFGIYTLSHLLNYFLENHLNEVSLFFVGCMIGIFPALIKQAGKKGRNPFHICLSIAAAATSFWFLTQLSTQTSTVTETSLITWITSGGIIGLGITFPGMSPSNFLMYLGLYQPINAAISELNFDIILPVIFGVLITIGLTAKIVSILLKIAYASVFHIIVGLVLTSTIMIIPVGFTISLKAILCLFAGLIIGTLMSKIDRRN